MRLLVMLIAVVAWFASPEAKAAGLSFIDIPADANGPALTGAVWSPCTEPPQGMRLRQVMIVATSDCSVAGERLPLIVMSHGSGAGSAPIVIRRWRSPMQASSLPPSTIPATTRWIAAASTAYRS